VILDSSFGADRLGKEESLQTLKAVDFYYTRIISN
jgi:hypothetical protein